MIIKFNWQRETHSIESLNRLSILFISIYLQYRNFSESRVSLIKWKFEYVRIDIFYSIIYNRIVKKSQLSTNLSSTNSVHKSFQLSTILRTTSFRHMAWNSTAFQFNILFQSLLFLHSNRKKKNWWKNTRKSEYCKI